MEDGTKNPEQIETEIQKILRETNLLSQLENVQGLLQNNFVEFPHKTDLYKVSKVSFKQKQDILAKKARKFVALLSDPTWKMEKDLIVLYKQRGIDIGELDRKKEALDKKRDDTLEKLGKALKDERPKDELEILKKEVEDIYRDLNDTVMERTVLLESSLESQLVVYSFSYMAFLTTTKREEELWVAPWESYEKFIEDDEELVNKCIYYSSLLNKQDTL